MVERNSDIDEASKLKLKIDALEKVIDSLKTANILENNGVFHFKYRGCFDPEDLSRTKVFKEESRNSESLERKKEDLIQEYTEKKERLESREKGKEKDAIIKKIRENAEDILNPDGITESNITSQKNKAKELREEIEKAIAGNKIEEADVEDQNQKLNNAENKIKTLESEMESKKREALEKLQTARTEIIIPELINKDNYNNEAAEKLSKLIIAVEDARDKGCEIRNEEKIDELIQSIKNKIQEINDQPDTPDVDEDEIRDKERKENAITSFISAAKKIKAKEAITKKNLDENRQYVSDADDKYNDALDIGVDASEARMRRWKKRMDEAKDKIRELDSKPEPKWRTVS